MFGHRSLVAAASQGIGPPPFFLGAPPPKPRFFFSPAYPHPIALATSPASVWMLGQPQARPAGGITLDPGYVLDRFPTYLILKTSRVNCSGSTLSHRPSGGCHHLWGPADHGHGTLSCR